MKTISSQSVDAVPKLESRGNGAGDSDGTVVGMLATVGTGVGAGTGAGAEMGVDSVEGPEAKAMRLHDRRAGRSSSSSSSDVLRGRFRGLGCDDEPGWGTDSESSPAPTLQVLRTVLGIDVRDVK